MYVCVCVCVCVLNYTKRMFFYSWWWGREFLIRNVTNVKCVCVSSLVFELKKSKFSRECNKSTKLTINPNARLTYVWENDDSTCREIQIIHALNKFRYLSKTTLVF